MILTPEQRAQAVFVMDTLSNDPRVSPETRLEAERQLRNQLALGRHHTKKLDEQRIAEKPAE